MQCATRSSVCRRVRSRLPATSTSRQQSSLARSCVARVRPLAAARRSLLAPHSRPPQRPRASRGLRAFLRCSCFCLRGRLDMCCLLCVLLLLLLLARVSGCVKRLGNAVFPVPFRVRPPRLRSPLPASITPFAPSRLFSRPQRALLGGENPFADPLHAQRSVPRATGPLVPPELLFAEPEPEPTPPQLRRVRRDSRTRRSSPAFAPAQLAASSSLTPSPLSTPIPNRRDVPPKTAARADRHRQQLLSRSRSPASGSESESETSEASRRERRSLCNCLCLPYVNSCEVSCYLSFSFVVFGNYIGLLHPQL